MLDCIPELPSDGRLLFVFQVEKLAPALTMMVSESVPTIQVGSFFFLNVYNLIFASPSGISRKTVQMQHRLVIALIIQVCWPISVYALLGQTIIDQKDLEFFRPLYHYSSSSSQSTSLYHLYFFIIKINFTIIWYFLPWQFMESLLH